MAEQKCKSLRSLARSLDFGNDVEKAALYIMQSHENGQYSQAAKLFNDLSPVDRAEALNLMSHSFEHKAVLDAAIAWIRRG